MYYDERENELNYIDNDYKQIEINTKNYDNDINTKNYDNDIKVDTINVNVNNFRKESALYNLSESLNKGNTFINEYIPYKNYIYKVVVKGEKDTLLLKIQELTFRIIDLSLYLDLYPNEKLIFNTFKSSINELNKLKETYENKYGPLYVSSNNLYDEYLWNKNPWPWMNGGNK